MSIKPVVAHFKDCFFINSETFIYNYLTNFNNYDPICLASEFINLDEFFFKYKNMYLINNKLLKYNLIKKIYFKLYQYSYSYDLNKAVSAIKGRNAKLIHAHFGPNGYAALRLSKKIGIPLVTNFYGFDISMIISLFDKWKHRYQRLFKEGDLFLVEGQFMKTKLIEMGCPPEKIKIQRIAIPLEKLKYRVHNQKKNGEKIIFIFCGRFVEKKGLIYALQAFKEVLTKYTNFEFRIIGDGLLKAEIEYFIVQNKMSDYVKLLGFLKYEDYLKEINEADILVNPSVTACNGDTEGGAPTTIIEAQAFGMPVLTSFHADIPNIVVPDSSALLSSERDSAHLAQNIIFLIENQDAWEKMGIVGRHFVEEHHNIEKEIGGLENKYRELIE